MPLAHEGKELLLRAWGQAQALHHGIQSREAVGSHPREDLADRLKPEARGAAYGPHPEAGGGQADYLMYGFV
ncbi:MAG: hypothetical protein LBW85_02170 [Deltaproteobacteria bacterium]|jgi:hypothetical protein|nr:hypothetical protein [Deltaproteobacteria bacterium]